MRTLALIGGAAIVEKRNANTDYVGRVEQTDPTTGKKIASLIEDDFNCISEGRVTLSILFSQCLSLDEK